MRFYICDREKECSDHEGCVKNGGECSHTTDPDHALKYPQCYNCLYRERKVGSYERDICKRCVDTDTKYHLEGPTNWKYEDPEGEWK